MLLEGSCHCGAIRFRVESPEPYPFMRCYCSIYYAAPWCEIPSGPAERHFPGYPDESLADWHRRHGLRDDPASG